MGERRAAPYLSNPQGRPDMARSVQLCRALSACGVLMRWALLILLVLALVLSIGA